jgi:hypothetical protein
MDALTLFGLASVTAMLIFYALEDRSSWYILAFAGACALGSGYGFMQGAWPFGVVEAIWSVIAIRRWRIRVMKGPEATKKQEDPRRGDQGARGTARSREAVIPRYRAASAASARFRTCNQQKMRGVIEECRIAAEAVLQHAQGMNKVGVGHRLRGIPVRVGREAVVE